MGAAPQEIGEAEPLIEDLVAVTAEDVEDVTRLWSQLTGEEAPETDVVEDYLRATVDSPQSCTKIIRDGGRIQAMATGTICRIPTGHKAWVDDVVTDGAYRGRGFGEKLTAAVEDWFVSQGVKSSNLTSSNDRGSAHRLYERMGYQPRSSTLFRKYLGGGAIERA